jgi:acyl-CoA reductase-like NAD-dependent aldehyde dehydrogenase
MNDFEFSHGIRQQQLQNLANDLRITNSHHHLVKAYVQDTGFLYSHVIKRELIMPAAIIELAGKPNKFVKKLGLDINYLDRRALGKIAVLLPKNSLGLTMSKALVASHIMGNQTVVKLPTSLIKTRPLYKKLLAKHFDNIEVVGVDKTAKQFLVDSITDPSIKAIVIYGDDHWIHEYWPLAKQHQKFLLFEGPGNDPLIVMESADIELSVNAAIRSGLNNGGQSCSASERFFIHRNLINKFVRLLIEKLDALKCGSPEDLETEVGPIFSDKVTSRLMRQIGEAQQQGAKVLKGGQLIENVYEGHPILIPTVLTNCLPSMSIVKDENFGPVFPIIEFDHVDNLIPMIDNSPYGLNASVFGNCPPLLRSYLGNSHRNVYYNSTAIDLENIPSRVLDGGCKRSGFAWRQTTNGYVEHTGYRYLPQELSQV